MKNHTDKGKDTIKIMMANSILATGLKGRWMGMVNCTGTKRGSDMKENSEVGNFMAEEFNITGIPT